MSKKTLIAFAVASALCAGQASASQLAMAADDSILIMFKPGVSKQERQTLIKQTGASLRQLDAEGRDIRMRHVAQGRIHKLKIPKGVNRDFVIKQLSRHPAIEVAEPNYLVSSLMTPLSIPNDPRFTDLWGLHNTGQAGGTIGADISAITAWQTTTGSHDVIIGVIDSGMDYNHPDLIDNRWVNDGSLPGHQFGYSTLNASGDPMDSDSHGTHVAGTIGATGNNGVGITGVSWQVTLLPCQFLGPTSGSTAGAIECIDYYTNLKTNYGVDVKATTNSWGGGGFSTTLREAIQSGGDAGILFIAAAGNAGQNADVNPMYPAAYDLDVIVSVASTDRNDNLSIFSSGASNYGLTSVDLAAPGSAIVSTVPGGGYASYSGTSMATPHVSGAAALLWSIDPDISPFQMKAILMNTGDSLTALEGKTVSGKRLNLAAALMEADPAPGFRLAITPRNQQIIAGESADFELDITSVADWNQLVELSVDVSPALEGVSLASPQAMPGESVQLNITTTPSTHWGDYVFTVTGIDSASGDIVKTATASLNIQPFGLSDYSYENTVPVPIPDNSPTGITSIINVPDAATVFGTAVDINITHTWRGDLIVRLTSPSGTEHIIHNRTGGSADDLIGTWAIDTFNNENMQGDWVLFVSDNAGADVGTLNSWGLTFSALADDITFPDPVAPVADFSYIASGLQVDFTDLSSDADNDISNWQWQFGDGGSSTEQNPSHSYSADGDYLVSLTVTDSTGLADTIEKTVTVVQSSISLVLHRAVRARTGSTIVDLRWSVTNDEVDVYRAGVLIDTVSDSGRYRDRFNSQDASVLYKICLAGTSVCSAELTVYF